MGLFTAEENVQLTRTGPDTPMGALFRQYWLPLFVSQQLPQPGGPPVEMQRLSEPLVADRDAAGIVHVRRNGIDLPTEEAGGIVWSYMGEDTPVPPRLAFSFTKLPGNEVISTMYRQPCNWLQGLEGDIDFAHAGYLHGSVGVEGLYKHLATHAAELPYGMQLGIESALSPDEKMCAELTFFLPCITCNRDNNAVGGLFHAWVPIDDYNHIVFYTHWATGVAVDEKTREKVMFGWGHDKIDEANGFQSIANAGNHHMQDWSRTKPFIVSGIEGVAAQDIAILQGMEPITDRTKENLAFTDTHIIRARRFLLRVSSEIFAGGQASSFPEQISDKEGTFWIAPIEAKWDDVVSGNCPAAYSDRATNLATTALIADAIRARGEAEALGLKAE